MSPLLQADPSSHGHDQSTASVGDSFSSLPCTKNAGAYVDVSSSTNRKQSQIQATMLLASKFNKKGAVLLLNGRCKDAIRYFRVALNHCKLVLSLHQNDPRQHAEAQLLLQLETGATDSFMRSDEEGADLDLQPDDHQHHPLNSTSRNVHCPTRTSVEDDSFFSVLSANDRFIYREPIHFTFEEADVCATESAPGVAGSSGDNSSSSVAATSLSVIIILNLAMAFQVSEVGPQQKNPRVVLHKALQLYGIAHSLQMKDEPTSNRSSNLRIAMIILNNVGEIHRVAGDDSKHEKCLQYLLSTVMLMIDNRRRCRRPRSATEVVLEEGFVHNTMHLILRGIATGAA